MSGHTSALSLGSIINAPIRRHYNSIRPHPEAATTLAPLRRSILWFIWQGYRTRARSRRGGFGPSIWPRSGWLDGLIYIAFSKCCGNAGTATPSGAGNAESDGHRIGAGARKSRSGVGLSRYRKSGVTEATDIFIAGQHWLPLPLAVVRLPPWPFSPIPLYLQQISRPSQGKVHWLSFARAALSPSRCGLSRGRHSISVPHAVSVAKNLVRCQYPHKPTSPAIHTISS